MVPDMTGSMDSNGGLTALRASNKDFLDIVYGSSQILRPARQCDQIVRVFSSRLICSNVIVSIRDTATKIYKTHAMTKETCGSPDVLESLLRPSVRED